MAGIAGKSGLKKGQTNNPDGRPVGSKNRVLNPVKKRIETLVEDNWDDLVKEIEELNVKDRVKAKIDLIKLIVPRPVSEEEEEGINKLYGGLAHLFAQGGKKEESGE